MLPRADEVGIVAELAGHENRHAWRQVVMGFCVEDGLELVVDQVHEPRGRRDSAANGDGLDIEDGLEVVELHGSDLGVLFEHGKDALVALVCQAEDLDAVDRLIAAQRLFGHVHQARCAASVESPGVHHARLAVGAYERELGATQVAAAPDLAIVEIARREGYAANRAAQSLRSSRTHTVGIVMPDMSNDFHSLITRTAESLLYDAGYNSFVCSTYGQADRERSYLRSLVERQVDGMLFVAGGTPLTREAVGADIPLVAVCRPTDKASKDCVEVNNDMRRIVYDGVSHLVRQGCTRVAFLVVFTGAPQRFGRWLEPSYRAALEDAGLRLDRNLELVGPHEQASYTEAAQLVGACVDDGWAPDGIFAFGDRLAMGAMNALEARGLTPGRDVRLLGVDDSSLARMSSPTLSSVARDPTQLAQSGVDALLGLIEGKRPPRTILVPHHIIDRKTTG